MDFNKSEEQKEDEEYGALMLTKDDIKTGWVEM